MTYHTKVLQRTCTKKYKDYGYFKPYLRADFNKRCGYCNTPDSYYQGQRRYQIDHFMPKSKFPKEETNYSNLVYSCPLCNGFKSDIWKNAGVNWLDPVREKYDLHLSRCNQGLITYKSDSGKFLYQNLKLYLFIRQIHNLLDSLTTLVRRLEDKFPGKSNLEVNELKLEIYTLREKISIKNEEY